MPTETKQKVNSVNTIKPIKTGKEIVRDEKGMFVNGHPSISNGRPQGVRDFATDFEEAVTELAKEQGITFSEARKEMLKVAYRQSIKGNYAFYKDTQDRIYGEQEPEKLPELTVIKEQKNIYLVVNEAEEKIRKELEI